MVGSAKLRTKTNTGVKKTRDGFSEIARKANWAACAVMLTARRRDASDLMGYSHEGSYRPSPSPSSLCQHGHEPLCAGFVDSEVSCMHYRTV